MTTITLTDGQYGCAIAIANARQQFNLAQKLVEQKKDPHSDPLVIAIIGSVAEVAFSVWKQAYWNPSIQCISSAPDFIINGLKIDIKATEHDGGRLLVKSSTKPEQADIFVLAYVKRNVVRFVGYTKATEILQEKYMRQVAKDKPGKAYIMRPSELIPFETETQTIQETEEEFL